MLGSGRTQSPGFIRFRLQSAGFIIRLDPSEGPEELKSDKEGYENLIREYGEYKCANYSKLPFDNALSGT